MKHITYLVVIFLFINTLVACSKQDDEISKTPDIQEVIVIDDGYKLNENGELIIDDQDVSEKTIVLTKGQSEESTRFDADGSQIKVMEDGYGNKTISRFFYEHPLITGLVTRISSTGDSKTLVYTKDGLVKKVVNGLAEIAESGSANEIANKLGITSLNENKSIRPILITSEYQNDNSTLLSNTENSDYNQQKESVEPQDNSVQIIEKTNLKVSEEKQIKKPASRLTAENTFMNEFESIQEKRRQSTKKQ